jgi:hypothetical protein
MCEMLLQHKSLDTRLFDCQQSCVNLQNYKSVVEQEKRALETMRANPPKSQTKCMHCNHNLLASKCNIPCKFHFRHVISNSSPDCHRGLYCHKLHAPSSYVGQRVKVTVLTNKSDNGILEGIIVQDTFVENRCFLVRFDAKLPIDEIADQMMHIICGPKLIQIHGTYVEKFCGKTRKPFTKNHQVQPEETGDSE